jgi:hypothetical protein
MIHESKSKGCFLTNKILSELEQVVCGVKNFTNSSIQYKLKIFV